MMPSNVEFEVTASHDIVHGSRSDEINMPKRGFQHVYKSTKTTSSLRVHAAYKVTVKSGTPRSKHAKRRDKTKLRKIDGLHKILSSPEHSVDKIFLSTRPVFYSGTTSRILPSHITDGHMLSAMEDLQVVDTVSGANMKTVSGDTVFTLIPRHASIRKMTHVRKTLTSLDALDKVKNKAESRGKR
jgi:hypothetical protein